ncbi:MAG: PAS domain-containing sensor histidine kinase [Fidelibacterota bacterium]
MEIGAVALFILVGFIGFQVIRRNEKQHIWLGMARETTHQLGTPVSSLLGWLERLRDHPDESARISEQMTADVARLKQIGDRFARMGSRPTMERMDVKTILSEAADYFEKRLPQTGRDVQLKADELQSIPVEGVRTLLSWAVENLLKNAIDAVDKPAGLITVRSLREGQEAVILIEDNGRGIPKRDWKNVFRPGYSTKEKGWGLGLSLTRRIIEEHQKGKVRIRWSEPGKGTVFEIRLKTHESQGHSQRDPSPTGKTFKES